MTNLANFDIANDLKVEMLLPQDVNNVFVLGLSVLGGTDVLGDDTAGTLAWQDLACEINRVQTTVGGSIGSNVFFQADAGRATIQMQSWEFDPNNYSYIRPSTPVRVRLYREGVADFIIWSGFVNDIDVSYAPEQPNQITIQATDIWDLLVNRRINYQPGFADITPTLALHYLRDLLIEIGFPVSIFSQVLGDQPRMTGTDALNTTFGAAVANILNTGLGIIYYDPNLDGLFYRSRATDIEPGFTVGNNHGDPRHLCMADIATATNADNIYNNVLITQKYQYLSNPIFDLLVVDQDSIDLYGERSEDFTVDLADESDAVIWAANVFAPKPVTLVEQVVTPAIDRDRSLTMAMTLFPGDVIGVVYETDNININTSYTITKVSHNIDVNNWFTTLETWKEF